MDARFPVRVRLRTPKHYGHVFSAGKRSGDRFFGLVTTASDSDAVRMGVVVAKRHVRFAVNRNRIKRVVRESFRQQRHALPPLDIVVMARPAAAKASNEDLFRSLTRHWSKLAAAVKPEAADDE